MTGGATPTQARPGTLPYRPLLQPAPYTTTLQDTTAKSNSCWLATNKEGPRVASPGLPVPGRFPIRRESLQARGIVP
eukprot:1858934-Prymnesium_polylepis.1